MIDINEAPDKTAATLEKFLENCEHEDPYIQNIWMAARNMVTAGLGHCEYQTQYASGTTLGPLPTPITRSFEYLISRRNPGW